MKQEQSITGKVPSDFSQAVPGGSMVGKREPGCPPMTWHRDIMAVMPDIMRNTILLAESSIQSSESPDSEVRADCETLDTIAQYVCRIYFDCRAGRSAFGQFSNLLQELQREDATNPRGMAILGLFGTMFLVSVFSFMFGSGAMAAESPTSIDSDAQLFVWLSSIFAMVPAEDRLGLLQLLQSHMALPVRYDFRFVLRPVQDYIKDIQKNQQARYEEAAKQAEKDA